MALLAILLCCCVSAAAKAADRDTQYWFTENLSVRVDDSTTITLDFNQRARSSLAGGDQYLDRIMVDHAVAKGVLVGVGAAYQYNDREKEIRTFQQFTLTRGALSSRSRLEQRMFESGPDVIWRAVQRFQIAQPIGGSKQWTLIANGDLFFQLNRAKPADKLGLNQFRNQIGLKHQFTKALSAQLTYMRQQNIRDGRPDLVATAPWVTLAWKL
ncbi:MAG: DUF2490 domain-containing protein [Sphingobium sp.]